mmetsp:Transcript_39225/g.117954  ORF Transcript_39225/g.117954 Transcript_39225/m.117954 type:complete len:203 (+) Transcript_39225:1006-1614(+)
MKITYDGSSLMSRRHSLPSQNSSMLEPPILCLTRRPPSSGPYRWITGPPGKYFPCLREGIINFLNFFSRHALPHTMGTARYRTVAARFYREKLAEHVEDVLGRGEYRGRDKNRQKKKGDTRSESKSSTQSTNGSGAVPREGIATGTDATRERSRSQPRGGGSPAAGAAKKEAKQAEGRRARSCSAEPRNGSEKQLRRSVTTL